MTLFLVFALITCPSEPAVANFIESTVTITPASRLAASSIRAAAEGSPPTLRREQIWTESNPHVSGTVQAPAIQGESLTLPIRAAFYYPWYPGAWTQRGVYPYTVYNPTRGYYDSGDPGVIAGHIDDMQYGGIEAGIASWWGPGTREDHRLLDLLAAATGTRFKWAVYYEDEGFTDPSVDSLRSDLQYLQARYASHSSFLRIDGRFVVFVYGGVETCDMTDRWIKANVGIDAYLVLKVFAGYQDCAIQPDGWHQYGPSVSADAQGRHAYTISPGFHLYGDEPRLIRDRDRWRRNVRDMVASGADWQLITTYNEWGEGTAIESAEEWASASGYGQYLDVLHSDGEVSISPTAKPAAVTTFLFVAMTHAEARRVSFGEEARAREQIRGQTRI